MPFQVPDNKKIRLIINTDAANEADDQYAIVHALLTPRFQITGIIAAHFGTRTTTTMEESYAEAGKLLKLMDMEDTIPLYRGAHRAMVDEETPVPSEGAELIIREAMKEDPLPLYVIFLGPLTDMASAYLMEPRIADRLTAVWIGGGSYPHGAEEFNLLNDIKAANTIMKSLVPLWQVPKNVYSMIRVSLAELAVRVRPYGAIGEYLYEQLAAFNLLPRHSARWPKGEMWMLGDSPAVSLLIDDHAFEYELRPAPHIRDDMTYEEREGGRIIRVYRYVDARFTLEDMYAKLALFHACNEEKGGAS
ncbi:nucleoside hydrolase [Paenibacillus sp. HB172176]|uniref:nucleoside hydrolase n=1 Tax=Paenibacillus sp. HB172176 TaxID=2493690 RepID=UPI00143BF9F2|nr:nucleoside hydrolase [Paenibacillus sp. HB172176]